MKMKRNLIILAIAAVVVVGFVVGLNMLYPTASPTASPSASAADPRLQISNLTSADVTDVTVQNAKQTYTVVMNDKNYVIQGQESTALDQMAAGTIFTNVASITAVRLLEENPKDLSVYGLDKPQATVTAHYKNGSTAVYLIGGKTPTNDSYYFMKQGDTNVFTVYSDVGDTYLAATDSLLAKEALTVTKDDIDTVNVAKNGETVLNMTSLIKNNVSIASWMIEKPWERTADAQQIDTYLTSVTSLAMDSVVDGNPTDLSKYGLDKPVYDITISGKGKTNEVLIGSQKDSSYTYAKFADSKVVYQMSTSLLSFTNTSAYMLMDKMILLVNIPSVTDVQFQGLNQQGTMVVTQVPSKDDSGQPKKDSNGNQQYDQTFAINGAAINADVARYFYQICIGLQTHSLIPEGTSPSSDTPVAVLTYHRNTDPTEIKIEFLPYDKDFYAVSMNGETNFLIAQEKVQEVADDLAKLEAGTLTVPKS